MLAADPHGAHLGLARRDPLALAVTVLAIAVLGWKILLVTCWPAVPDTGSLAGVAAAHASGMRAVQVLLEETEPGTLRVRRRFLSGDQPGSTRWSAIERVRRPGMLNLVRSYGYTRAPMLITLDDAGRVLRVEPAPTQLLSRLRLSERSIAP
ncbi:MAG TPA: hypothetical protein VFQ76_08265 [Longimicrobiaceae bacterium]|nr:hypothetical protein [Longimicrobiaceae bacterium]